MPAGLPAARSARPPAHLTRPLFGYEHERSRPVTIADARSCGYVPFEAVFDGEMAGIVLNQQGEPVEVMEVEALPSTLDARRHELLTALTLTDRGGRYRIAGLPPGRYQVGINLRDEVTDSKPFPAVRYQDRTNRGATGLTLGFGSHIDIGVLRVPPSMIKRRLSGTLVWRDGRPIAPVLLSISEEGHSDLGRFVRIDDPFGAFSVELFEGRTYVINAEDLNPRRRYGFTEGPYPALGRAENTVTLHGDLAGVRLVLVPRH
jgi:hypothetical protein